MEAGPRDPKGERASWGSRVAPRELREEPGRAQEGPRISQGLFVLSVPQNEHFHIGPEESQKVRGEPREIRKGPLVT
eukprot:867678-Pyramimonas_sp.AAC.1